MGRRTQKRNGHFTPLKKRRPYRRKGDNAVEQPPVTSKSTVWLDGFNNLLEVLCLFLLWVTRASSQHLSVVRNWFRFLSADIPISLRSPDCDHSKGNRPEIKEHFWKRRWRSLQRLRQERGTGCKHNIESVPQTVTSLFLEQEIRVLNLGSVKSDALLPTAHHRCDISSKATVLSERNDRDLGLENSLHAWAYYSE